MQSRQPLERTDVPPATLGDVLYHGGTQAFEREADWAALVQAIAAGDQRALHALYERAHKSVYTLAMRITGNKQAAEAVTLEVFLEVRRQAATYDPAKTTVLAWIMGYAQARAAAAGAKR
jgi:RNA polymerase sigma-70 factor (ECF subfamily)